MVKTILFLTDRYHFLWAHNTQIQYIMWEQQFLMFSQVHCKLYILVTSVFIHLWGNTYLDISTRWTLDWFKKVNFLNSLSAWEIYTQELSGIEVLVANRCSFSICRLKCTCLCSSCLNSCRKSCSAGKCIPWQC